MPELPEVETIKRQLKKEIVGKKIKAVEVKLKRAIQGISIKNFKTIVQGATVTHISRRAKLILIELSNHQTLVTHLKLTGQLIYNGARNKHTHLVYYFNDGSYLLYNDLRQFGYIKLLPNEKIQELLDKKERFGPEPLEKKFTLTRFQTILAKKPRAKIKIFLMDQKNIAGIGNIYSDEILFSAGIRPTRLVKTLAPIEIKKIYQDIKKILTQAIRFHGTSENTYLDTKGQKGKYGTKLKVYQKENQACYKCGHKVKRLKLGGRSAHFCPQCQK